MADYDTKIKQAKLGKWNLVEKIGSGASSRVYLAYDPIARRYAAIKVIKRTDSKFIEMAKNEAKLQASLKHPNILAVQESHEAIVLADAEDRVQTVTAIVLDYAIGGDILKLIDSIGIFPERLARTYFHQLIDCIEFLHKNEVAHRDIKPENIMLDEDYCVKLADFGCSIKYTGRKHLNTAAGTSKYFPPEVHAGSNYEGIAMDLFGAAIVVFCITLGHMPFLSATEADPQYRLLISGKTKHFWKFHEEILREHRKDRGISSDFRDLMTKMLDPTPVKRMTIEEIKKSVWYNGAKLDKSEIVGAIKARGKGKVGDSVNSV